MANFKKGFSYIFFSHPARNRFKGTFTTLSSLQSFRKTSSILEVGTGIFAPFHSTCFYDRQKLFSPRKLYMTEKFCEPTADDEYTKKIKYFCEFGPINTAIEYLEEMVGKGFRPDVVTYAMVIDRLLKYKGQENSASKLLTEMAFHHRGIRPYDPVTYTSLLHAIRILSRPDDNDIISKLLIDMKERRIYVCVKTFNIFVDAYCKEGRMEDAESLVKLMMKRSAPPDVVTYKWIIDGYRLQGNMSKAREVFDSTRCRGVSPNADVYNTLLYGYIKDSKIQQAMPLFHEMEKNHLILHALCTDIDIDLVQLIDFELAVPNNCTYKIVMQGLCNNNQVEEAISLLYSMLDRKIDLHIDLYNILIRGASEKGKLCIARNLYNDLTIRHFRPNARTYAAMIDVFCQEGLTGEAYEMFLEMKKKSFVPNGYTYHKLIRGFANNNQHDLVKLLVDELTVMCNASLFGIDG